MGEIAQVILDVGMDFIPDVKKVWDLTKEEETPITVIPINELTWLFNYPFLWVDGDRWNLKPRVLLSPLNSNWKGYVYQEKYKDELKRIEDCNIEYPIHVMKNRYRQGNRLVILDGLHRLMKLYTLGEIEIKTHILPRSKIPLIKKPDYHGIPGPPILKEFKDGEIRRIITDLGRTKIWLETELYKKGGKLHEG
jgi:hypothetical protein